MDKKITAVIQTYKRPQNLEEQLYRVRTQSVDVNEILISHPVNDYTAEFDFSGADKVVRYEGYRNPFSRYITATCCERDTDFFFFLDDDVMPGRQFVKQALKFHRKHGGVWGGRGEYVSDLRERKYRGYWPKEHMAGKPARVDWNGGHCTLFPAEHLHLLFSQTPPFEVFSGHDDIWVGYLLEKHGINRYVTPYHDGQKKKWGVHHLEGASSEVALHRSYDGHEEERKKLITWILGSGFEPLNPDSEDPVYVEDQS